LEAAAIGIAPGARGFDVRTSRMSRAFTLVELVLVLTALAVLAAVAIPRYGNSLSNYRADLAARRLATDLEAAQAFARAASSSRTFAFTPGQSAYQITGVADMDVKAAPYRVSLSSAPYQAALGALTFSDGKADDQIVFDGYGVPDSGATIEVVCRHFRRTVTLDAATGSVSVN
jgi:prepilin-type N-terminal cleavage/methylation domain-containing protein